MQGDTRPHGFDDAIDWHRTADWLRWHLADVDVPGLRLDAPLEVRQPDPHDTHHHPVVRFGGADLALHTAGASTPDATAHLARTADWLTALHPHYTPAPRVFVVCTDVSVLGRAFFVTAHRRGLIVGAHEPLALHDDGRRRALAHALVESLADLHSVDVKIPSLAAFGREPGALDRDLTRWLDRWAPLRGQIPDLDAAALWLHAYEPADALDPTVVHGSYGLTALRLDPLQPDRILAVLDWERASLGDPLSDLGTLLAGWVAVDADEPRSTGLVTAKPGYPSRDELAAHYARRTGRSLDGLAFHEVFGLFRRAVTLEGTTASARQHAAAERLSAEARARAGR